MLENQLNHNLSEKGKFFPRTSSAGGWSRFGSRCSNRALKTQSFTMSTSLLLALFSGVSSFTPPPTCIDSRLCIYFRTSHYGKAERITLGQSSQSLVICPPLGMDVAPAPFESRVLGMGRRQFSRVKTGCHYFPISEFSVKFFF